MTEKNSIKKRSIIYSIAKIFLIFFLTFVFISVISLRYGITLTNIHTKNFQLEELYIKWDKKLVISLQNAKILQNSSQRSKPLQLEKTLRYINDFYHYVESVSIHNLQFKDINVSMFYAPQKDGYIKLRSNFSFLDATIYTNEKLIQIKIDTLEYFPYKTKAKGYVLFDKSKQTLQSVLHCNIAQEAFFDLHTDLKNNIISYQVLFTKEIVDTKKVIQLFSLPKPVQYWVMDAIKAKDLQITKCEGKIDLKHPKESLKGLYIQAYAHNLEYKYHPKIEPVISEYTLLEFKNGILYIKPHNATQYGYDLQNSYLQIDFTQPEELLTLYLRFDSATLDKNILHILSTYHIDVPLYQNSGTTKTDLTIKVKLRSITVEANGSFYVKKGNFHYLGMDIDVEDVLVKLHNSDIKVTNMKASLQNKIQTTVDIDLQLAKKKGIINFHVSKVKLPQKKVSLQKPIDITYFINPVSLDTIEVSQSLWDLHGIKASIQPLKLPFDFKNFLLTIPQTTLHLQNKYALNLQGDIHLKNFKALLDINIPKMQYKDFSLQKNLALKLQITPKRSKLYTTVPLYCKINTTPIKFSKLSFSLQDDIVYLNKTVATISNSVSTKFSIYYDLKKNGGHINLYKSKVALENIDTIFQNNSKILLRIANKTQFSLYNKDLGITLKIKNNNYTFTLESLQKLLPYSKLLQRYKITDGTISLKKNKFYGTIYSKYALLLQNNKLSNTYKFKGKLSPYRTIMQINNNLYISLLQDAVKVEGKNIALNLVDTEKLISDISEKNAKTTHQTLPVTISLQDGYLYITDSRRILYNQFDISIKKNIVTASLRHHKAQASFKYINKKFHLFGSGFDDVFMDNLFMQSKFKGGELSFNMIGSFDEYDGVMEIKNTTILDYKILNNILAFIDTVPSLITFSLPKYSQEGLKVYSAYASFHFKDNIFNFDNINLDSDHIDIVGKGTASYTYNTINLLLQLKTEFANKASKIPVVGYILFDGKTISTSLKVQGKLNDPKVELTLAKDIAVAPLNIIKRTILYPLHLFGLDKTDEEKNATK